MSTKRPHDSTIHPSRRTQVPLPNKRRKTNPHPGRNLQPKNRPLNPIKSRIRSLQRQLAHADDNDGKQTVGADIRLNRERELASLRWDLQEAENAERRKVMIGKWHMVRFFDKQKAGRVLRRAERALRELGSESGAAGGEGARKEAEEAVYEAQVDVNYAQYCPLDQPYSSLYPSNSSSKEQKEEEGPEALSLTKRERAGGDPKMRALVKQCMLDNTLDKLRNGKIATPRSASTTNGAQSSTRPEQQQRYDDEEQNVPGATSGDKKGKKREKKGEKKDLAGKSKGGNANHGTNTTAGNKIKNPNEADDGDESDGGFFE